MNHYEDTTTAAATTQRKLFTNSKVAWVCFAIALPILIVAIVTGARMLVIPIFALATIGQLAKRS
jgi:hypothetical protein